MIRLQVLASSSEGNAYVIQTDGEALLLEAGAPFRETLKALDYDTDKIAGCLITHEHGDHAGHINELLSYGLPVYASKGTIEAVEARLNPNYIRPRMLTGNAQEGYESLTLGGFTVQPFATQHDAAEPLGFLVWHEEAGTVLFATDTYYLAPKFEGLNHVLIECNYSPESLARAVDTYGMSAKLAERIRASHLSLDTCIDTLLANDLHGVSNIVLIHVSSQTGDARHFRTAVERATGIPTVVARPGVTVDLGKDPF
jgi:phosphoribosyl 1,2-cyclic phosphodiesterase